ncbi:hypothetical protein BH11MYX1_BH11MYX1_46960 [soil metagenome]
MRPIVRTATKVVLGGVGLVLALGLVIHLPPIKHWLGAHGHHGAGVCPLGYGTQAQHVALAPSKARPTLGFELGATTAAEIERWGQVHGVTCSEHHHGAQLDCEAVPSSLLGDVAAPPAALSFSIDSAGAVRSIEVTRRGPQAAAITAAFDALSHELAAQHGAPIKQSGIATPEDLSRGALRQAMVEYRATDYRAVLRATNMGDGFVLTEHYALMN